MRTRGGRGAWLALLVSLAASGCGGRGGGTGADAGHGADGGADAGELSLPQPALPALPAPPELDCLDGWDDAGDAPVPHCEPWPSEGAAACARGQAHFPGATGCAPIGRPCPAGSFAEDLPVEGVLYVDANAAGPGTGSALDPYPTLDAALGVAPPGATIALGKGTHSVLATLDRAITLRGACAAETLLRSAATSDRVGTLAVTANGVTVEDVAIEGDRPGVTIERPGAGATLRGVLIEGALAAGVVAFGALTLEADGLVVRGTRETLDARGGRAVLGDAGATVTLRRAVLEDNVAQAVYSAGSGTVVRIEQSVLRGTRERSDGTSGLGIDVFDAGRAEVVDSVIEGNQGSSVIVVEPGSTLRFERALVRDTRDGVLSGIGGSAGSGLQVKGGAQAEIARSWFSGHRDTALLALGRGTLISAEDVVIWDTRAETSDGEGGSGITVDEAATVHATRALLHDNQEAGVLVLGGATFEAEDITVRGTVARPSDEGLGSGLAVQTGTVRVTRGLFEENQDTGLLLRGASATLTDVRISETREKMAGGHGRTLTASAGTTVTATRIELADNHEVALIVDTANMTVTDMWIRGTRARSADARFGMGANVVRGGMLDGSAVRMVGSRGVGLAVGRDGAEATLTSVAIVDTAAQDCASTSCSDEPGGIGAAAVAGGSISLANFAVGRSALAGVVVEANVVLTRGEVFGSPIGVALAVDGYDADRLTNGVRFRDNDVNLDSVAPFVPLLDDAGL